MDEQMLLHEFELLADAPNTLPKLREMILDLAVRGRLVPQDPTDEPAAALLRRIGDERQGLYRDGVIRKPRDYGDLASDEAWYALPESWQWVRLGIIGDWGAGSTPSRRQSKYYDGGTIPWLKIGDLNDDVVNESDERVTPIALRECSLRVNRPGDILVAMYGSIGKLGLAAFECTTNQAICACTPYSGVYNRYLFLYLKAARNRFIEQGAGGVQSNISKIKIVHTPFALPPFPEQRRIVAKVDELMRLCDELESRQEKRRSVRVSLNTSALDALQKADREALPGRWQFVRDHFDLLYQDPQNVQKLKETILQLAVQGRLTRQDPNDEPASELLKRIEAEKQRLYEEGKVRKPKKLPPVKEEEKPFEVPKGWAWARLGEIGDWGAGATPSRRKPEYYANEGMSWLKTGELADGYIDKSEEYITPAALRDYSLRINAPGDILIAMYGATIGKLGILSIEATTNQACCGCTPFTGVFNRFLFLYLRSLRSHFRSLGAGGAQPNISKVKIETTALPLPPVAEQYRIVAKVDELIRLCDEMENVLKRSAAKAERLLEAVVREVVSSPVPVREAL